MQVVKPEHVNMQASELSRNPEHREGFVRLFLSDIYLRILSDPAAPRREAIDTESSP